MTHLQQQGSHAELSSAGALDLGLAVGSPDRQGHVVDMHVNRERLERVFTIMTRYLHAIANFAFLRKLCTSSKQFA